MGIPGGTFDLPLQTSWLGGGPAWSPADTLASINFLPAELQAGANSPDNNILAGDILTWTTDNNGGDPSAYANYLFTSNVAGTFDVSGYLWDADLTHPDRPQYWYLYLNSCAGCSTPIAQGILDGTVDRADA